MATRGTIARWTDRERGQWEGREHHFDSYPDGLGRSIFENVRDHFKGDVAAAITYLIDDHPAGWSCIVGFDFSEPAGYRSGRGPECYCHGQRSEEGFMFGPETADAVYVYVLDPSARTMTLIRKVYGGGGWREAAVVYLDGAEPDWEALDTDD